MFTEFNSLVENNQHQIEERLSYTTYYKGMLGSIAESPQKSTFYKFPG